METKFNLVEEPWIPIADAGRVSLGEVFSRSDLRALGGNPLQKVALTKLLLAIAQAAQTPADKEAWQALGPEGLAQACREYLAKWHERFWLEGPQPFLQMPAIEKAAEQSFGAVLPEVATGNTTLLTQFHRERPLSEAERAVLLVSLMGFGLGGKKTDNSVVLSAGYSGKQNDKGKPSTGKPGPFLGFQGFLHHFWLGANLWETLWLNLFTHAEIQEMKIFKHGLGQAPWEQMPTGEACPVAETLKTSLMGRLLPLSRFCLLTPAGLHYSEGLAHPDYKSGMIDPSVAFKTEKKAELKAMWVNPEKRPWRELTSLLSFLSKDQSGGFQAIQITSGFEKFLQVVPNFSLWSGGLRVSSNAGEQYVSGTDDFVESSVTLQRKIVGKSWFGNFKQEMEKLEGLATMLYACTMGFYKELKVEGKSQAASATHLFWQLCERQLNRLIEACQAGENTSHELKNLRQTFKSFAQKAYDDTCPHKTGRQFEAWANNQPHFAKYLS